MYNEIIRPGLALFLVMVVISIVLGFTDGVTRQPIVEQIEKNQLNAKRVVLPQATKFETVEMTETEGSSVRKVEKGLNDTNELEGYVVSVAPKGYAGEISLMIGFDKSMAITKYQMISTKETPGLGSLAFEPKFSEQYVGKNKFPLNVVKVPTQTEIQAITGATITSKAVTRGVNDAAKAIESLGGAQ